MPRWRNWLSSYGKSVASKGSIGCVVEPTRIDNNNRPPV
jgi:hypothetical protein